MKIGQKVRVKVFKKTPAGWNFDGEMDKWMGKLVTIKYISHDRINNVVRIQEDSKWRFRESNFEENDILDDRLFEI